LNELYPEPVKQGIGIENKKNRLTTKIFDKVFIFFQNSKYYLHPDTGTACCTCIRVEAIQARNKFKNQNQLGKMYRKFEKISPNSIQPESG
jgi:hypothetical protein